MLDNTKIRCWFSGGQMIKSNGNIFILNSIKLLCYKLTGVINLNKHRILVLLNINKVIIIDLRAKNPEESVTIWSDELVLSSLKLTEEC